MCVCGGGESTELDEGLVVVFAGCWKRAEKMKENEEKRALDEIERAYQSNRRSTESEAVRVVLSRKKKGTQQYPEATRRGELTS